MIIQNVYAEAIRDGKLRVRWLTMDKVCAIQISIALDSQFSVNPVHFVLPENASESILDVGNGSWYIRIGAWIGDTVKGQVKWSGILGPISIQSAKAAVQAKETVFEIPLRRELPNGYRLFSSKPFEKIFYLEVSTEPNFLASETQTTFMKDTGIGFTDITGLQHTLTYFVRCSIIPSFPTKAIFTISKPIVFENVKPLKPVETKLSSDRTQLQSDLRILEEIKTNPKMRFSSYADYMRLAAARTSH